MSEKKVYNLKETSLGKMTFPDGAIFIAGSMISDSGERVEEVIIYPSIEDALKGFSSWAMGMAARHVKDALKFHNDIIAWLVENWLNPGIVTLQQEMYEKYGFAEFRDTDPIEWIKSEPEMVSLTLCHIAGRFTNGYVKCPVNQLELTLKFVKNIIGVQFWEDGNPTNSVPLFG